MKTYRLEHDTPEILRGAIVKYSPATGRYKVINLDDVARYNLNNGSYFTFHRDVVENSRYWFEQCMPCCGDCDL